jgi:hypothetical protein
MSESLSSIKTPETKYPSLDSPPIYKVKQLLNGQINTIYVFYGKTPIENEEELFAKIFTDKENELIKSEGISVKFSEQQIHFDDSIGTIKIKILNELKVANVSIDELYLYCQKKETLNAISVYQSLTQNNKIQLTKIRLEQFISNIISDENGDLLQRPEDKDVYNFDDIFEMNIDKKKYIVNKVLGQKFFIVENEYPFVCDPYDVKDYDVFFEKSARKSLTTLNSHLLLNSGDIIDNSIYLCLTENVVSYLSKNDISEETTIKIYYPFLHNKNINNLEDLENNKDKLIENNTKILNEKTFDTFKTIDMFYDVYNLRKSELKYINRGIKYIKAVIKPEFDIKISLDIIFKIIHATEDNPLIKYNPSSRQENVYRLYTDKISTDGRKIPYLKKSVIFKLMKNIARNKSVSIYIETKTNENTQSIICDFDEDGFITISSEFINVINIDQIDEIFKSSVNPIIQEIKGFLEQSGYKLNIFNSLRDENIEIKQLTYETQIAITKPLNIESYKGCISSIFINETNAFKGTTINLRFKRVSNYSKFNSQEAFILEKSEQGLRGDQIIEALIENFREDLTREQAVEMVRKIANELEVERGVRKTDIKIKENPGFKTIISLEQETGIIIITTENINNINYLYTLPIYLDTIVRLTQDKKSTKYNIKSINKLCLTGEKEDIIIEDIISSTEESASNSEVPSIDSEEEEVHYTKFKKIETDKPKGALSLFFDEEEEEDEDENENFEGGQATSESSIPSEESIDSDDSSPNITSTVIKSKVLPSDDSITSEKSVTSEKSLSDIDVPSSSEEKEEKSVTSEKSLSDIDVPSSSEEKEQSVSSEKSLSNIIVPSSSEEKEEKSVTSEKSLSNIVAPSSSEEKEEKSLSNIIIPSSSEEKEKKSVTSEKSLSNIVAPSSSEEKEEKSVTSEKSLSNIVAPSSSEESEKSLSNIVAPSSSEEKEEKSVTSEKSLSNIIVPSSSEESEKSLSNIIVPSSSEEKEQSVSSEKSLSNIVVPSSSEEKEQSVSSEKSLSNIVAPSSSEEKEQSVTSEKSLSNIVVPSSSEEKESEKSVTSNIVAPSSSEEKENEKSVSSNIVAPSGSEEKEQSVTNEIPTLIPNKISKTLESDEEASEEEDEDIRNIDGMKLNKPYYFQTLIEKKDPILILKEDTPQYNSYTRTCSSNLRRQPVILTDNQLEKINKEHPGFLREEDVIKYGSDPKKQYNYICPRFWCLKNNTLINPIDLKEVKGKDGKIELVHPTCGKVLPKGEKKVKPGYYIYEFYKPKPGKKDYKKYPGLIPDSHPDNFCLPCCFDKYNTEGRIKANKKCYDKETKEAEKINNNVSKKREKEIEEQEEDDYIMGPEKYPLNQGRWGFLPVEIQIMFREFNADCQVSKTNTKIKENHPCLLRHGVEINNTQSFISCISDELFFLKKIVDEEDKNIKKQAKILTVKEMRERIIKAISIDTFIKYQNGNLVTDFHNPDKIVDVNKYNNTKLFSKLNMDKSEDKAYYSKVVSAYENFILFLKDDEAIIDHTYLWDIISMPNKYLFPNGVNLLIFHLPKDDITNNVQVLCPTNHYSSEFYQSRKPTIILLKEDKYYEPIYLYTNNNNKKLSVVKEFKEQDTQMPKNIRSLFNEFIKPFFNTICKPLDSMPNIYKAKRPLLLYDLVQKLDRYEYKIINLVMNFNNKVIGVIAEEPSVESKRGFIPCYPSALDDNLKKDIDFVFMNDLKLWDTYKNTINFLNKLDKRSKKRRTDSDIPCKPAFKVVEDEHVVGILTNTNQFIQISKPIRLDEVEQDLVIPSITNDNYIINVKSSPMVQSEVEITTRNDVDKERVDYIKKIRLETSFYNVFRNTIRVLINDYDNASIRVQIENELLKKYIIYSEKFKNINKLIKQLVGNKIQFIGDENYYKLINEVSTCLVKDKKTCSETPKLCTITEDDKCNLILPEKNLITNKINEPIYYGRITDEFIRYNRIKIFMLNPQSQSSYLSFTNIGYNLRDNEIILIQSLLTQDYFDNLVPSITNKYIKYISYDEVEPNITQVYDNLVSLSDHNIEQLNKSPACEKNIKDHITSSIWRNCFPEKYTEIEYNKSYSCTFDFIIDLIDKKTNTKLSINQIKNELYEEYKKYLSKYIDKIVSILIIEGKKTLGDQVRSETLTFSNLIYTENYFLTTFDLWLLVNRYKIPSIFISQQWILQTNYKKHEFIGYGELDDNFAFIVIPGLRPENIPKYKLIQSDNNEVFISLNNLNSEGDERISAAFNNKVTIEKYLDDFLTPKRNYINKKPKNIIIESDSEQQENKNKRKKKKIIIEDTSSITPEKFVVQKKNKKTKKNAELKGNKKISKKNIKTRKLLIADSSTN